MSKQTLRSMGIGFLCAALLSGAYAVFGQGNVPVPGVTVNSLFNGSNNDKELAQYREEVSKLQEEKSNLESEKQKLSENMSALEEQMNKQSEKKEETTSGNSIEPTSGEESTVSEDESTEATNEENNDEVAAEAGSTTTFTISEGEDSTTIANRLAEEGIIQDSAELQEIIANWGLDTLIQAGEYELSPDMSVHQVAEILTNGAYYYIP
ncbi:endolytic transglycosylase MltG [Globicatella sulfidifaciens]|uniref:Endolytic transglycosylase MltG n=1 Tax=Globicatella sulfidifaciens TaxID=136093 RepID=A0A7X8GZ16_9LACT|nr:endolytic transglycosylase MltG [Globicatella sulfidifaciens]NLJ17354.1 hypothetical protein [Globicatella sulfidifaciens]